MFPYSSGTPEHPSFRVIFEKSSPHVPSFEISLPDRSRHGSLIADVIENISEVEILAKYASKGEN